MIQAPEVTGMKMSNLFWLTDDQMERLKPFFPKSHGKPRVDDRRVLRALLHKSAEGGSFPIPGQTYPVTSVMGVPSAVKPLSTATRTWNSAT